MENIIIGVCDYGPLSSLKLQLLDLLTTFFSNSAILKGLFFLGKYMYIETSYPRRRGDKAILILALYGKRGSSCLSFYYHMYGSSVGTLNVYNGKVKVFSKSSGQGNNWKKARVHINLDGKEVSPFQIAALWRNHFTYTWQSKMKAQRISRRKDKSYGVCSNFQNFSKT